MPRVVGTIRNTDGTPYEGALVEAYLNRQYVGSNSLYGNESLVTFSDSYGRFYLELVPTIEGTFYTIKITKNTVSEYQRLVPDTDGDVNFEDLEVYSIANDPKNFIGSC